MEVVVNCPLVKLLTVENKVQRFEDLDRFRVKQSQSSVHDHMVSMASEMDSKSRLVFTSSEGHKVPCSEWAAS